MSDGELYREVKKNQISPGFNDPMIIFSFKVAEILDKAKADYPTISLQWNKVLSKQEAELVEDVVNQIIHQYDEWKQKWFGKP